MPPILTWQCFFRVVAGPRIENLNPVIDWVKLNETDVNLEYFQQIVKIWPTNGRFLSPLPHK